MGTINNLIRNTSWSYAATIFSMVSGFVVVSVITLGLGIEGFGMVQTFLLFSLAGYLSLLEMGFQASVTRYTSLYLSENQNQKVSCLLSSSFFLFLVIGAITGSGLYFFIDSFVSTLNIPQQYQEQFELSLKIIFVSYLFQFPNLVLIGTLKGYEDFKYLKIVEIIVAAVKLMGITYASLRLESYLVIVIVIVFSAFLSFVLNFIGVVKYSKKIKLMPKYISLAALRETREMSGYVFLGNIASLAFHKSDRVILGAILGPTSLGVYEIVSKIPMAIKAITGQINGVLLPMASKCSEDSDFKPQELFEKVFRLQLLISLPILFSTGVFAGEVLSLWLTQDMYQHLDLMRLYLVLNIFNPILSVGATILLGQNRGLPKLTFLGLLSALVNILITLLLVPKLDVMGAILGTLITQILISVPQLLLFQRMIGFKWKRLMRDLCFSIIISIAISSVFWRIGVGEVVNWWTLAPAGFLCVLAISIGLFFGLLKEEERERLCSRFNRILKK